ncbi:MULTISPECIES: hypothetical protein [Vibrio]|uniref:hypothetical protein n=1 Tax=Vibrio TaxID=662 RepID=UPI000813587A|nr:MULTISPECIES: hypothetical protein [Vibrio]APC87758.1 hypothetical protein FORC22_1897 [Vibrio parahaemolyticus]EGQ9460286.1 hypothetical protein [Vibrio parahaemolyticus]EGQ9522563.1 hypothetical protein [Vibrio parahaemolyticus]EGR0905720.1 hypothetical protein [Vibrio parahaemolyticus]EGR3406335.1 hypothetical protein [Vibrio parahaemolyticus]
MNMENKDTSEKEWGSSEKSEAPRIVKGDYHPKKDPLLFRYAMITLSMIGFVGVLSYAALAVMDKPIPTELNSATMLALGALSGLLMRKE